MPTLPQLLTAALYGCFFGSNIGSIERVSNGDYRETNNGKIIIIIKKKNVMVFFCEVVFPATGADFRRLRTTMTMTTIHGDDDNDDDDSADAVVRGSQSAHLVGSGPRGINWTTPDSTESIATSRPRNTPTGPNCRRVRRPVVPL